MLCYRATRLLGLSAVVGCSMSAADPAVPEKPTRSLGLAFKSGPCLTGENVVPAAAFVSSSGRAQRYLRPADGDLRFTLAAEGVQGAGVPISLRWLSEPNLPDETLSPAWNLELVFNRPPGGACPIRIEFQPSPQGANAGLQAAEATVLLTEPPPPPPALRTEPPPPPPAPR